MLNIDELIKDAIKNKNTLYTKVYRAIKAEILNFKTAKNAKPYTEQEEIQLLKRMCKQREDSIFQYEQANRDDLVQSEALELDAIRKLLPEPVNESELYYSLLEWGIKNNFVTEEHITYPEIKIPKKSMGEAIKHLQVKFPANDNKEIVKIVKKYII